MTHATAFLSCSTPKYVVESFTLHDRKRFDIQTSLWKVFQTYITVPPQYVRVSVKSTPHTQKLLSQGLDADPDGQDAYTSQSTWFSLDFIGFLVELVKLVVCIKNSSEVRKKQSLPKSTFFFHELVGPGSLKTLLVRLKIKNHQKSKTRKKTLETL